MSFEIVEILLVEDNPGDVLLTRKAFEKLRLVNSLAVVPDGEAALDYMFKRGAYADVRTPDLILLDINLPRISGHEVLAQLKADPVLRLIPVVMLTSSDAPRDVNGSYGGFANSYITKPPSLDGLISCLKHLENYWFAMVKRPVGIDA